MGGRGSWGGIEKGGRSVSISKPVLIKIIYLHINRSKY